MGTKFGLSTIRYSRIDRSQAIRGVGRRRLTAWREVIGKNPPAKTRTVYATSMLSLMRPMGKSHTAERVGGWGNRNCPANLRRGQGEGINLLAFGRAAE
jgi:hypothetical protein